MKNGNYEYILLYSGQLSPIARLDADSRVVEEYVYGSRVNVPEYMIKDGRKYRFITDHRGSVRMVVDTHTGEVMQRTDYDEFGYIIDEDLAENWTPVLFGYAGGLQDRDTGLIRFGARDYDPMVGRWTSKEPLGFNGSSNFYTYANNDPVNYVDVTGLAPYKCSSLEDAVLNGSSDIIDLYNNQTYEMQEYGTMIMKLGACYFYTKIQEGYKFGPDMGAIDIAKLYDNAIEETKKLFPGAIPIASIHNHPTGGNWTTLEDNERTAERGILNITLLKGPDQYSLKTTRGVRKNKEPYRKEVLDSYVFLLRYNVTN